VDLVHFLGKNKMDKNEVKKNIWDYIGAIGTGLQGFSAPMLGDYQWGQRQSLIQADRQKMAQEQANQAAMNRFLGIGGEGGTTSGGNFPPGSTYSQGGFTIPLNPALSNEQRTVLASQAPIKSSVDTILGSLKSTGVGKSGNFYKQMLFDTGWFGLMGKDTQLKDAAAARNVLEKYVLFDEAGKALTGPEKGIMIQMLNTQGLDEKQIYRNYSILKGVADLKAELVSKGVKGVDLKKAMVEYATKGVIPQSDNFDPKTFLKDF